MKKGKLNRLMIVSAPSISIRECYAIPSCIAASNYLSQLEERLERLETEKLQLVKVSMTTSNSYNNKNIYIA